MPEQVKTIKQFLGLNTATGDVGVEIEVEAKSELHTPPISSKWRREEDGSLRGYSAEYVTKTPVDKSIVPTLLDELRAGFSETKCGPKQTYRAGVHVHVNVQQMTAEQVIRFALLYYCFEDVLVRFCGETREGNHFCLRIRDAEGPLVVIEGLRYEKNITKLHSDRYRYSSLNFCALFKYGSIEFRAMETRPDLSKINEWVEMLVALRDYSLKLDSRTSIPERMSYLGPEAMLYEIIGESNYNLVYYKDMERDILRSMRLTQMAIYNGELQ